MVAGTAARRVLAQATVFLFVVLATTGVWLVLTYAPGREQALGLTAHPAVTPARWLHRVAGLALVPVSAGFVATTIAGRPSSRTVVAAALLAVAIGMVWTGYRLPWDQLALSATRTAGRFRGMVTAAFDANVEVVRIGGREVDQADFRTRLLLHLAVLPASAAVVAVIGAVTVRRHRARRTATGGPPPPKGRSGR